MWHLHSVGKWPVLSLLRLKKQDFMDVAQLFFEYNRALGIMSLISSPELNPPIILHILSFLPADFRLLLYLHNTASTSQRFTPYKGSRGIPPCSRGRTGAPFRKPD